MESEVGKSKDASSGMKKTGRKGVLGGEELTQQPPLPGVPGGLAAAGFEMKEFGVAACLPWGVGVRVAPSCNADAGSEGGEAQLVSVWAGGDPPSPGHPGFIPFPYSRSHHGYARSRSLAVLALALTGTRSQCPGDIWREAEPWAEVSPEPREVGVGRVCTPTPLGKAPFSWFKQYPFGIYTDVGI